MKRNLIILYLLSFSLLLGLPLTSMAQNEEPQTIVDPLTVSGTVGTQITSSWNNADLQIGTSLEPHDQVRASEASWRPSALD